ncbi:MAG: sigma-54-dependent Fis family transcriptional regulator [Proteobacteria bacterium]|jgi:DNA-binding NtrC family response regulator|nr:sigma-54 dependent transcriptional regulator [Alphaproteobacteria bacterium]NCC03156.1 sigma-54-dependent Fis family transcriptional regulator [Pseudomonadota bacterium]
MRLLIVGFLQGHIATAGQIAKQRGAKVAHIESIDGALNALRSGQGADLVMCDVEMDIATLIESLKSERISVPVIACGIGTDAGAAVRAIRAGAKEYVPLPPDAELIAAVLQAVAEEDSTFIAIDPVMKPVLTLAERVAMSDASILITGESGTGKEVMAHFIHHKSRRATAQFVSLNCAAIPENLLESELFGHEKGAFTGAIARRIGKFEEANGGTLLLDEISEMDLRLQAKLLRAIQEREIDRVGGTTPIKVDIRVIATSNRNLEDEVRAKRFREDLYYRLNVVSVYMPPLRDRPNDIEPLATYFIKKYAAANGLPEKQLSDTALGRLQAHMWRGNVRELENTMHRAILLSQKDEIEPEAIMLSGQGLSPESASPTAIATQAVSGKPIENGGMPATLVGRTVADVERDLIIDTLQHCLGNRTHAANILGISIRTLRNKLKLYSESGVPVPPTSGEFEEQAIS